MINMYFCWNYLDAMDSESNLANFDDNSSRSLSIMASRDTEFLTLFQKLTLETESTYKNRQQPFTCSQKIRLDHQQLSQPY